MCPTKTDVHIVNIFSQIYWEQYLIERKANTKIKRLAVTARHGGPTRLFVYFHQSSSPTRISRHHIDNLNRPVKSSVTWPRPEPRNTVYIFTDDGQTVYSNGRCQYFTHCDHVLIRIYDDDVVRSEVSFRFTSFRRWKI